MTDTSPGPVAAGSGDPVDDSQSRRRAAAEIRRQHPGYVVIWAPDLGKFRAWPLIRAPRGTVLTAETPGDMAAQIERIEQAAARGASRRTPTPSFADE